MEINASLALLALDPAADLDLAEVALGLARDEYPDLDVEAYLSELDGMAHEASAYLRGGLSARVTGLCRYLFHEMGFRGNIQEYHDPRNSYLNQVLDRRTGIPITMSALAMIVGRRAGLEVAVIGLPGHFIAKATFNGQEMLFDPFHGGRQLTPLECEQLVFKVTGSPFEVTPASLRPLPLGLIVLRMLTNLKSIYLRQGDYVRTIRTIERMRQLSPNDPIQERDLGISLLHTGQPGRAIDHLLRYLETGVSRADLDTVKQLLAQAQSEVAPWN